MSHTDHESQHSKWRPLYPFASRWFSVATGRRLHYIDERPATSSAHPCDETLLFVHGNPTWSFHWRRLIETLRSKYRCVAIDHLGCGLSDKPREQLRLDDHIDNLAAFVRELDLRKVTLIAQDWGAAIGLGTMLHMPERLEGIVLFNCGAFTPRYVPWRIRVCRRPLIGRLLVQGANLFSSAALRMTLSRCRKLEPAAAAGYLAPYDTWANRRAVYGFVRDIPSYPQHRTWQTLAEIDRSLSKLADLPSLLIWGMRDWCFRPDCLVRFEAAWPDAEVHRLEDVGHWVVEDAPEESLAIVARFLACRMQIHHSGTEGTEKIRARL
jgi:haloalkane dehalogenase